MKNQRVCLFFAACLPALAELQTGTIRGVVTSEDGKGIGAASVIYTRVPGYRVPRQGEPRYLLAPGETFFSGSVSSNREGQFEASGLPAGGYLVCVEVQDQPFLNPCKWSVSTTATVKAADTAQVLPIILKRGVYLKVRVDDPRGLLPRVRNSPLDFPHLIVGVTFGTGAFLGASTVNIDGGGRDFQMVVPHSIPSHVSIFSRHVTLEDSAGAQIDHRGAKLPFQAREGQDHAFRIRISGRAPDAP